MKLDLYLVSTQKSASNGSKTLQKTLKIWNYFSKTVFFKTDISKDFLNGTQVILEIKPTVGTWDLLRLKRFFMVKEPVNSVDR